MPEAASSVPPAAASRRTVLFDLDGTLTDPGTGIAASIQHALTHLGRPPASEAQLRACVGPPLWDGFRQVLGVPEADVEAAVAAYREHFGAVGLFAATPYDGIAALLDGLHAAGARLAVATSKPTVYAEKIVSHVGLAPYLRGVYGATFDGAVRTKTQIIGAALDGLGAAAGDTWMVGDRSQDVVGAHAHGVRCVGVLWGYGAMSELIAADADALAEAPADVAALVR